VLQTDALKTDGYRVFTDRASGSLDGVEEE
jgi:hypothetical protein